MELEQLLTGVQNSTVSVEATIQQLRRKTFFVHQSKDSRIEIKMKKKAGIALFTMGAVLFRNL